ncbi:MAG: SUMF1/EgtB/PvdO family nonheme iron enzyme [Parachlamydia sp.]|jgi:formylglycine-generating enzyme required for sulfatase activity|nr:SUMF1/EgtB/PvdO family nonheme iron enzyme [Parachlamydia sp.]
MDHRILGDYHLIKPIGQGTLGTVFLAEHRFMKRQCTLKILPEELAADPGFIQRFQNDISLIASLDHPQIVKTHNISFSQGTYFIVTDCITNDSGETKNLAHYLNSLSSPLDEEEIYHILYQAAQGLDYAHEQQADGKRLSHLGLKLNNILVGKKITGKGVQIFLSDFGLSWIIGSGAVLTRIYKNVAEALTIGLPGVWEKTGEDAFPSPSIDQQQLIPLHASFLQSYAFLAPEQKRLNASLSPDIKADSYAFGVLAYYLLMKELPEGIFEMPSQKEAFRYSWDPLLQSCLQANPVKRPTLLVELMADVRSSTRSPAPIAMPVYEPPPVMEKCILELPPLAEIIKEEPAIATAVKEAVRPAEENSVNLRPFLQNPQLERPQTDPDPAAIFQINTAVKVYNPERKDVSNIKPILTDMVIIQGGAFYRGSQDGNRDEMPRHQIFLPSFAFDMHPITNEQFVRFLEVMGGEKDSNHIDIIRLRDSRIKRSAGKLSIESGYSRHPVVGVTWYGAIAYAKWVGKRLPTEAEWEIASRGGVENALYPTGEEIEKSQANFFSSDTTPVMSYAPNGFGLYDLPGNVYEWCHDWYGYNYYEASIQEPDNPQGPLQGVYRVLRGGCWKSLKEDLRCSRRHRNNPGTVNGTYGFRCAADVQEANA